MSWKTGSSLFEEIASLLSSYVTDYADRIDFHKELIRIFENYDAELSDVYGSVDDAFDDAYDQLYPSEDNEYSEDSE